MKVGGNELGVVGSESRWVMSWEVKLMVVDSAPLHAAGCAVVGEAQAEAVGERSLGSGCARGTQLSVYIVRRGIS
jgi:hypothetical protein